MTLGLIGPGKHGHRYLLPRNNGERFGRVLCRSGKIPSLEGQTFSVTPEVTTDSEAFFRHGLSGCVIATPPDSHRGLALRAIDAGIPVLVEKPLALCWDDCAAIIDAAERKGVPLLVGHTHLFSEAFEALPRRPAGTITIGGARGAHAYSALFDWGSHAVAMALDLAGSATPLWWKVWPNSADSWDIAIQYRNGQQLIRVVPERVLRVDCGSESLYTGQEPSERTPMARMVDVFQRLIKGGKDPRASLDFYRTVYGILCSSSSVEKVN